MRNIREEIIDKLKDTEVKHDVKIVFAIESGSRGWGFESPDSDYDCRFVYVKEMKDYLTVQDKVDYIEYEVDEVFDINGWDLKKFLSHILKSNANLLEWLSSNVVYLKNEECTALLEEVGKEFFNPTSVSHHYLSMAKKKYDVVLSEECKIKTYFYVLRPLANLRYIYEHKKMPYMEYFKTLDEIDIDEDVKREIIKLYDLKISVAESYIVEENRVLVDYFKREIEFFNNELKKMKYDKNRNTDKIDDVFRAIIDRMW